MTTPDSSTPVPAESAGAVVADSPAAPDFTAFKRDADARDLARVSASRTQGAHDSGTPTDPPAVPAASTDATSHADSEPAAPAGKPGGKNLQTRHQELDADIQGLQEKLKLRRLLREELETDRAPRANEPPASKPAPTAADVPEWKRWATHPNAPKIEDFPVYEDFVTASAVFAAEKVQEAREQRARLDQASRERMQSIDQTISTFKGRVDEAAKADPTFEAKIHPGLMEIRPAFALAPGEPLQPVNAIMQACVESEAAPALLLHFSSPEGRKEWQELAKEPTPASMLRRFGRIEARILAGSTASAPAAAKPVTSAPDPPTTLGRRAASSDPLGSALRDGNYTAYKRAADAADLARRRG